MICSVLQWVAGSCRSLMPSGREVEQVCMCVYLCVSVCVTCAMHVVHVCVCMCVYVFVLCILKKTSLCLRPLSLCSSLSSLSRFLFWVPLFSTFLFVATVLFGPSLCTHTRTWVRTCTHTDAHAHRHRSRHGRTWKWMGISQEHPIPCPCCVCAYICTCTCTYISIYT